MVLVLLMAAALRLGALPDYPVGLHYDEAANVILTRQIAHGGYRPLFIRAYTGKEVLFFYIAAPWIALTGGASWGLRLGAAMLGVLTVAATGAMARALLGDRRHARAAALLAATWMAGAFPHVLLSRYGFRAIAQPLLQALTVAALWRGLRARRWTWLAAAGALLGLTGYTYLAARLFPIPLGLALAWLVVRAPAAERPALIRRLALVLLMAAVAFAPLGLYFLRNPGAFTTRIEQVAAPSWRAAGHGVLLCLRALVLPGAGDPYARFNAPGRPMLDGLSALLALLGLGALLLARLHDPLERAARWLLLLALPVMLLPSALATSEITPSNLRMVGLYPFLALLPALGVLTLARWRPRFTLLAGWAAGLALIGGTGLAYGAWAASPALFAHADGPMQLAAQALDAAASDGTTVYIASIHYRHPTVAALARRYHQAKWLTGGDSVVLPAQGDAVYLVPADLHPPAPWPAALTAAWDADALPGPDGAPALWRYHLSADAVAALRDSQTRANFAHVVGVHAVTLPQPCYPGAPCPVFAIWEPRVAYPHALDPVARLIHPQTGEWARTSAFHYPPEQWTPGDVVWDYLVLTPPVGMPPGDGYQVAWSFYNPETHTSLPRLEDDQFAGLEARFPAAGGFEIAPSLRPPTPAEVEAACAGIPRQEGAIEGLRGWTALPAQAHPGKRVEVRLCWRAPAATEVTLALDGEPLDAGPLDAGAVLEARHAPRIPRDAAPGPAALTLTAGDVTIPLGQIEVLPLARAFAPPDATHALDFGASIRLLAYDVGALAPGAPLPVTFTWQSLAEVDADYRVFVHLIARETGQVVAQTDEMPQHGRYPTSWWLSGEVVRDVHLLPVPADLPPSEYALRVGFYRPLSGAYLPVEGERGIVLPLAAIP